MKIKDIQIYRFEQKLSMPFTTALGSHASLNNLRIKLNFENEQFGLGECAIAPHILGNSLEESEQVIEAWKDILLGADIEGLSSLSHILEVKETHELPALASIEMAYCDAMAKDHHCSITHFLGSKDSLLKTAITLVIADTEKVLEQAKYYDAQGFKTFKIKLGKDLEAEKKLLKNLSVAHPTQKFIVDANQGYSSRESIALLEYIKKEKIAVVLFEQPVKANDWTGFKAVKENSHLPIAADESVKTIADAKKLITDKSCDVFNIKLAKMGIYNAIQIAKLAQQHHIKIMSGMMMESVLGVSAAAQFAPFFGNHEWIDLDTPYFIENGLGEAYFMTTDGVIDLSQIKLGLGYNRSS